MVRPPFRPPAPARRRWGCASPREERLRVVLYSSIQAATLARAWALVAKCWTRRSSHSRVGCQDSMTALRGEAQLIEWQRGLESVARRAVEDEGPGREGGWPSVPGGGGACDTARSICYLIGGLRWLVLPAVRPRPGSPASSTGWTHRGRRCCRSGRRAGPHGPCALASGYIGVSVEAGTVPEAGD